MKNATSLFENRNLYFNRVKASLEEDVSWFNPPASYESVTLQDAECDTLDSAGEPLLIAADKHVCSHGIQFLLASYNTMRS